MEAEEIWQQAAGGFMRFGAFLFALSVFTLSFFFLGSSAQHAGVPFPSQNRGSSYQDDAASPPSGDGVRMLRQAEIRVLPTELGAANRAELVSLRDRVTQVEINAARIEVSDPAVREQIARQLQLAKALLSYAERLDSQDGKSPVVVQVEHRLNRIEGRMMCEACHGGSFNSSGVGE